MSPAAGRLAADGAAVVVNYASSAADAQMTVDAIVAAGGKAVAVQGDVAKRAQVTALFDAARKRLAPLTFWSTTPASSRSAPLRRLTKPTLTGTSTSTSRDFCSRRRKPSRTSMAGAAE